MDDAEERVLAGQPLEGKRMNGAGVDGGIPEGTGAGRAKVRVGGAQESLEPPDSDDTTLSTSDTSEMSAVSDAMVGRGLRMSRQRFGAGCIDDKA